MPQPEIPGITDRNQLEAEEIAATLHRMVHQVDEMHAVFTSLRPVLEAFQRGGVLGARTAAKRLGRRG